MVACPIRHDACRSGRFLSMGNVVNDLFPRRRPQETPRGSLVDQRCIQRRTTLSAGCYVQLLVVTTLFWCVLHSPCSADLHWSSRQWSLGDGGEPTSGRCIAQLPDGGLAIGTDRGLLRFDGQRTWLVPLEGPPSPILHLLATRGGDLHVLFKNGRHVVLDVMAGGKQRIISERVPSMTATPAPKELEPTSLCETTDGSVWVAHRNGFVKRLIDRTVDWFPPDEPRAEPMAWVCVDTADAVWRIDEGRLATWRNGQFETAAALPTGKVAIAASPAGGLWIQAGTDLFRYRQGLEKALRFDVGSPTNLRLFEDRRGCLWVGTSRYGLSVVSSPPSDADSDRANARVDEDSSRSSVLKVNTTGRTIFTIMEDRGGDLWTGTPAGVEQLSPAIVWRAEMPTPKPLRSICNDGQGNLWFVTLDGQVGCERRRPGEPPPYPVPHGMVDYPVLETGEPPRDATCLAMAPDGGICVGTRTMGILAWDGSVFRRLAMPESVHGQPVSAVLITRSGTLVASVGDSLLWRIGERWHRVNEAVPHDLTIDDGTADGRRRDRTLGVVTLLAEDASSTIWAVTADHELITFDAPDETIAFGEPPKGRIRTPPRFAVDGGISAVCPLPGGSVWIGLRDGGLCRWREGRFSWVGLAEGIPSLTVVAAVSDGRGRLWCASGRSVYAISEAEAEAVADGRRAALHHWSLPGQEEVSFFDTAIVPPGNTLLDAGSRVLIILPAGIAVCMPDLLPHGRQAPLVDVDNVTVDGRNVLQLASLRDPEPGRTLRLPADPRRLELRFAERSLSWPTNVRVQHQLEGVDDSWLDSPPDRVASYPRLSAGRYRFRLRSSTDVDAWEDTEDRLTIVVDPLLWERPWFRVAIVTAVVAATAGATAGFLRRRNRRRIASLREIASLHQERMRIARDMHDEVGTNLTQIALLASVARVGASADQVARLEDVATIARQTAAAFDEIVWAINPKHDTLPHLLSYLLKRAEESLRRFGIACEITTPDDIAPWPAPAEFRRNVLLIVKEAVGNVVKHAGASHVWIDVQIFGHRLRISVRDDGCGMRQHDHAREVRDRRGLVNMIGRAAGMGGNCRVEPAPDSGTIMTLEIPIP